MPSRRTTFRAQWIPDRSSPSMSLATSVRRLSTTDCDDRLTKLSLSGGFGPGLIRLVESKEVREIKFRDEDVFDIKAGWGRQKLKLARRRGPMQVTVGRSPLCWWCPDSPEVNDLPGSAAAESLACPVPNLGAGTSARRNRQRHRPCHALRSAECGWTTPDDADPATEGPVLEIGVLDFDGEDPVVIHADAAVTEVLPDC